MSPATTIAAYAVALAAVFGGGLALGGAVGPVGTAGVVAPGMPEPGTSGHGTSEPGTSEPGTSDHSEMDQPR